MVFTPFIPNSTLYGQQFTGSAFSIYKVSKSAGLQFKISVFHRPHAATAGQESAITQIYMFEVRVV